MSSSLFLSSGPCCFSIVAPTVLRRGMRRLILLHYPLSSSISRGISTEQQEKEQEQSEWKKYEELTLRLQGQLGKIGEKLSQSDTILQQQVNSFSLMNRQQTVMERRIVALEEEAARTQQKIAETTRLASDVVLQHRNVEALVHQMEKLVLKYAASLAETSKRSPSATEECEGEEGEGKRQQQREREQKNPLHTIGATSGSPDVPSVPVAASVPPTHAHTPAVTAAETAGLATQIGALSTRLEALQARVEQLTMEKLVLDRVLPHAQEQRKVKMAVAHVAAVSTVTVAGKEEPVKAAPGCSERNTPTSLSPKALATLLRDTGAFPFKDNTGVTRIASQKVLIRGVPVNFGAADVRDLVSRVGNVITCVVRRIPVVATATTVGSKASRYRSQQLDGNDRKNDSDNGESVTSLSTAATTPSDATGSSTTAAVQEEEEVEERGFEVTFQAVEQAVRAVLELDKHRLHGNYTISVEPVVASDILAALRQLERDSKKR